MVCRGVGTLPAIFCVVLRIAKTLWRRFAHSLKFISLAEFSVRIAYLAPAEKF
jgi:hypothetical protein